MQTKPLLYGLVGFFIGGFIVSVAATTFDKPANDTSGMSMNEMTATLQAKTGDDYDKAFIESMIIHHQSAVDMAKLSESRARHDEIKQLSTEIISAQEKEIAQMEQWTTDWGYTPAGDTTHNDSH